MNAIFVFLFVLNIIMIVINIIIMNNLVQDRTIINKFMEHSKDYTNGLRDVTFAFNEVKAIVNSNNAIYASWGETIQHLVDETGRHEILLDIHAQALGLNYHPPKIDQPDKTT